MEERKTFSRYSLIYKAIAVMLVMTLMANFTLTSYAATPSRKYVREVILVTAKDFAGAEAEAKKASDKTKESSDEGKHRDYIVYEKPIFSNGETTTWLCYATTDKASLAVTSIKTMNMRGGWSYEDYDKFLAEQWNKAGVLVNDMLTAVREYNTNLEEGKSNAIYAKSLFDMLYEDDSKQSLSDFFSSMGTKANKESAKENECVKKMTGFLMEANANIIYSVENALMLACKDTYTKLYPGFGNNIFDGLENTIFLNSLDQTADYHEFDNYADDIINSLPQMQEALQFYMRDDIIKYTVEMEEVALMIEEDIVTTGKSLGYSDEKILETREKDFKDSLDLIIDGNSEFDLTDEQIEAAEQLKEYHEYFDYLPKETQVLYTTGRALYAAFSECFYLGYKNELTGRREWTRLLDLMTRYDLSNPNTPKNNYTRRDFYPLIELMSPGQRALLKVGFTEFVTSVMLETEVLKTNKALMLAMINGQVEDDDEKINDGDTISVYFGVDRSLFEPDSGIALTNEAIDQTKKIPLSPEQAYHKKVQRIASYVSIASASTFAATTVTMVGLSFGAKATFAGMTPITSDGYAMRSFCGLVGKISNDGTAAGNAMKILTKSELLASRTSQNALVTISAKSAEKEFQSTFSQCLKAFIAGGGLGTILTVVNVLSFAAIFISLIVERIEAKKAEEADTPYIDIPRVMCSYEHLYDENADAGLSEKSDYIYYYGVKNMSLTAADQQRAAAVTDEAGNKTDILKFGIGDVANWTLHGGSREWVALYAANDRRVGNPILAGKFMVTSDSGEIGREGSAGDGYTSVKKFNEGAAYDLQKYYINKNENISKVYLGYKMEESSALSQGASVFSNITPVGMLIVGVVAGGAIGTLCTWFIGRKRKKNNTVEG